MAYTCVLAPSIECDGCGECDERRKSDEEQMRWDRYEAEYDYYKEEEYLKGSEEE